MDGKRKTNGKANVKYFESSEVLRALDDVKEWLQKNAATKKVSHPEGRVTRLTRRSSSRLSRSRRRPSRPS